jgi:steroid 5-alpha reductase family enzyme
MDVWANLSASLARCERDYNTWHAANEALGNGVCLCIGFIVYSFVWSVIGRNASKVDQIWSIVPVIYCWQFFFYHVTHQGDIHYRLLLLCILVTFWGARLTFNFWRKGGYGNFFRHEEDYRWPILRR